MPKWKSANSDKAVHAVRSLTDQADIARAAREAPDFNARRIAVEMLEDQAVLAAVAQTDATYTIREEAADKLADRALARQVYAYIADDDGGGVRVVSTAMRIRMREKLAAMEGP